MTDAESSAPLSAWLIRGAGYFVLWMLLIGVYPADLLVGLIAATTAAGISIRLMPPERHHVRLLAVPRYLGHFAWQSVLGGIDVARRAFSPSMPMNPGLVRYSPQCPRGGTRNALASLSSLLPGTLTVDDGDTVMLYHCLDLDQPVQEQLGAEEAAVAAMVTGSSS